jgi:signal transduction histidine kinase
VASATRALSLILDNAHKFLVKPNDPIKGSVTLRVVKAGSFVRYEVEDTGIGIPKAEAEHIFEEFVQLDENYNGTGIGLSVARSIARRLGGDVILDTYNSEQGSRFVMTLPCSKND